MHRSIKKLQPEAKWRILVAVLYKVYSFDRVRDLYLELKLSNVPSE